MCCCVLLPVKPGWARAFREMREYLFVYGTLRTGLRPTEVAPLLGELTPVSPATALGKLYDLGEYPGAILAECSSVVIGELLEISDALTVLQTLDNYEGFDPRAPSQSLFVRTKCCAFLPNEQAVDAWIYVYNQPLTDARLIESGDYAEVVTRPLPTEVST